MKSSTPEAQAADADLNEAVDGLIARMVARYRDPLDETFMPDAAEADLILSATGTVAIRLFGHAALRVGGMTGDASNAVFNCALLAARVSGFVMAADGSRERQARGMIECGMAATRALHNQDGPFWRLPNE